MIKDLKEDSNKQMNNKVNLRLVQESQPPGEFRKDIHNGEWGAPGNEKFNKSNQILSGKYHQ